MAMATAMATGCGPPLPPVSTGLAARPRFAFAGRARRVLATVGHHSEGKAAMKVIEHVVLLQMKPDLTEEQEKDMLDNTYTLQYYFRGILAISLGPLMSQSSEQWTHGVYMRFPSTEVLEQYNVHPAHVKVGRESVFPYCEGLLVADFEAEVEDELEAVFRRGEEFESGVEHIILLKVEEAAPSYDVDLMLQSLKSLRQALPEFLVQVTAGKIFSAYSQGYTHCVVARLPSAEALDAFHSHEFYVNVFTQRVLPLCRQVLSTAYRVAAIGTTVTP